MDTVFIKKKPQKKQVSPEVGFELNSATPCSENYLVKGIADLKNTLALMIKTRLNLSITHKFTS